ncbi:hypothetical protein ACJW30_02G030100 [Castanea mollissima]
MRPKLAPTMVMKLVIMLLILTLMITSAAAKGGGGGGHGAGGHGGSGGHEAGGADQGSGSHQDGNGDITGKPKIIPVHGNARAHGSNNTSNLSDSWFHSILFLSSFFFCYICFI